MNPNENQNPNPQEGNGQQGQPVGPDQPIQPAQQPASNPVQQPQVPVQPQQILDPQRVAYAENYLRTNMSYYPIDNLKSALIAGGYSDAEVAQAVSNLNSPQAQPQYAVDPLDIGYLFKSTWDFFRKEIFVLGIIPIISYLPSFLLGLLFGLQHSEVFESMESMSSTSSNVAPEQQMEVYGELWSIFISNPIYIILAILSIAVGAIGTTALYKAVVDFERGERVTLASAYKTALPFVFPFILVMFLQFLAILGGLVLFIVPGIIFALWFLFSQFSLFQDNCRGTAALKHSKEIVSGKMGAVFLRILLLVIIVGLIRIPFSILSLIPFFGFFTSTAYEIAATIFTAIFSFHLFKGVKQSKGIN